MEHRPNSNPDTSSDVSRSELPILSLTEHYIPSHGTNQWDRPKCVAHSTKGARLRSFIIHDWSHVLQPPRSALSDIDFFFTGKIRTMF